MAEAGEAQPEDAKARKFLNSLFADNLTSAKEHILADIAPDAKLHDFEKASEYVGRVLNNQANLDPGAKSRNVYAFDSKGRGGRRGRGGLGGRDGRGRGCGGNNTNLSDAYYPPEDWNKLTHEQPQKVRDLRTNRDKHGGVQAIERSTRPRTEETAPTPTAAHAVLVVAGVGSQMNRYDPPAISGKTKVDRLVEGIKTNNHSITSAVEIVMNDPVQHQDFDKALATLKSTVQMPYTRETLGRPCVVIIVLVISKGFIRLPWNIAQHIQDP